MSQLWAEESKILIIKVESSGHKCLNWTHCLIDSGANFLLVSRKPNRAK